MRLFYRLICISAFLNLYSFSNCEISYRTATYDICSKACGSGTQLGNDKDIIKCLMTCETDIVNLLMERAYEDESIAMQRRKNSGLLRGSIKSVMRPVKRAFRLSSS